jgi:hypothetical protein
MANGNGKQGKDEVKGNTKKGPATPEEMQLYSSLADAQAHKPEGRENWELWQFGTPEGKQVWIWGGYGERCLWQVCDQLGWSMINTDDVPTRSQVGAQLAALSPEDQAILIAQFVPKGKK